MKRIGSLLLAALLLALALVGCTPVNGSTDDLGNLTRHEMTADEITAAEENLPALEQSAASLGAYLFRETYREKDGESVLISPVSVLTALGMLALGTTGEAKTEMEALLGMTASAYGDAMRVFAGTFGDELRTANSVWMRDDRLHVEENFLQALADRYDAGFFRAPFDETTVRDVNAWISEKTDKMIPKMIDRLTPDDVMLLVNALCFDAQWAEAYEKTEERKDGFTNKDGGKEDAEMLFSTENIYFRADDGTTGFVKFYEGAKYAFAAILPPEGADFDAYVNAFTGEKWNELWSGRERVAVSTMMPAFSGDTDILMNGMLGELIPSVFDPAKVPLRGIGFSDRGELYVGWVLHKTHIEVSKNGTKAAAATVIDVVDEGCVPIGPAYSVMIDRPFLYAIVDVATGTPLFFGCRTSVEQ